MQPASCRARAAVPLCLRREDLPSSASRANSPPTSWRALLSLPHTVHLSLCRRPVTPALSTDSPWSNTATLTALSLLPCAAMARKSTRGGASTLSHDHAGIPQPTPCFSREPPCRLWCHP